MHLVGQFLRTLQCKISVCRTKHHLLAVATSNLKIVGGRPTFSLPSFPPWPIPPFLFFLFPLLPVEVGPSNSARGLRGCCMLPQRGLGLSPSQNGIWCILALIIWHPFGRNAWSGWAICPSGLVFAYIVHMQKVAVHSFAHIWVCLRVTCHWVRLCAHGLHLSVNVDILYRKLVTFTTCSTQELFFTVALINTRRPSSSNTCLQLTR